ncbi:MAG: flavodoxin domain-containing protein [Candidatus Hodarchaeales archaeon]
MTKFSVLVGYASRFGSTAEIAHEITDVLSQMGLTVELVDLKQKSNTIDINSYNGIIIGSGIKMGRWTKDALKFLKYCGKKIHNTPLAVFVSSGKASNPETYRQSKKKYLLNILEKYHLDPSSPKILIEAFGGVFDFSSSSRYSSLEKKILQRIAISNSSGFVVRDGKLNDFRNWQAIREWATEFGNLILISNSTEKSRATQLSS